MENQGANTGFLAPQYVHHPDDVGNGPAVLVNIIPTLVNVHPSGEGVLDKFHVDGRARRDWRGRRGHGVDAGAVVWW